jgi:hypothetical protein
MRRPQFTLKTLLWLMAVVAGFLGGMVIQRKLDEPKIIEFRECGQTAEAIVTQDGRTWVDFDSVK